jgi:DNA topoisomerase-1
MQIPSSLADHRQLIREKLATDIIINPQTAAKSAGLRYVSDDTTGWTHKRWGRGFSYFDEKGDRLTDKVLLNRIICPDPNGHLQATGRDQRGRKQYRYHPDWSRQRSQAKFDRMIPLGWALPLIRQECDCNLGHPQLTRNKILAVVVRLLDETLIRVGNPEYAIAKFILWFDDVTQSSC